MSSSMRACPSASKRGLRTNSPSDRWRCAELGRKAMTALRWIAALLPLCAFGPAQAATPLRHVSTARMSEITRVLASNEFQGRAPGTPGEEKTIPYLIEQFKAAGLE